MNLQLQQRIAQMKKGQIPNGYKKTEFGVFPCDWVTDKTLGDLFEFHSGLGKSREELSEEGTEYLHYGDMHQAGFSIVSHEQYSHLPKYKTQIKENESFLMRDGDVAFLDASEDLEGTSRAVLIDNPQNKPFIAGLHIILGRPKGNELEKCYKQYLTVSSYVKKQFQRLASGFKVYGLNKETLPQIRIAYPSDAKEQAKIAEILMAQERVIDLYGKKIEQLKKLKKIALQKMFPKKGKKVPEIRFPGFTGDWEQRKVGDVIEDYIEKTTVQNQYPVLTSSQQQGIVLQEDYFADRQVTTSENIGYYVLPRGYFTYRSRSDTDVFVFNRNDLMNKGIISYYYPVFSAKEVDSNFLLRRLNYGIRRQLSMAAEGTGQHVLAHSKFKNMEFLVPSVPEQERIGTFFEQLDNLITLHQRLRDIEIKRLHALIRLLLTGIGRVII